MEQVENNQEVEVHSESHAGPHVPAMQGEQVWGPISNTAITTFLFMLVTIVVSIMAKKALKKEKSRLKEFFINIVGFIDSYLIVSFGEKKFARDYLPLIGGVFFIILFGNLFGLIIDWFGASISSDILRYVRPMHSDLNTTLVLGTVTVVMFLIISFKYIGTAKTVKGYLFNFTGDTLVEKFINVFVGWLHFIGVPSAIASLSLRLFGNIFAGVVLIGVISFLGSTFTQALGLSKVGLLFALPFWFFEVFVAFIQAAVFAGLMITYFGQSKQDSH